MFNTFYLKKETNLIFKNFQMVENVIKTLNVKIQMQGA